MKEHELDLDFIRWLAHQYAISSQTKDRTWGLLIVRRSMEFNPVQTAYFCQQVASWMPHEQISMCLTIYTNRLWNQFGR